MLPSRPPVACSVYASRTVRRSGSGPECRNPEVVVAITGRVFHNAMGCIKSLAQEGGSENPPENHDAQGWVHGCRRAMCLESCSFSLSLSRSLSFFSTYLYLSPNIEPVLLQKKYYYLPSVVNICLQTSQSQPLSSLLSIPMYMGYMLCL